MLTLQNRNTLQPYLLISDSRRQLTRYSRRSVWPQLSTNNVQWRHEGWCHPGRQLRVSPLFCPEKNDDLFSHHPSSSSAVSPYLFFSPEKWRPFLLITVTFIDFTRVSPPGGYHPAPFLPVRPRLSIILCVNLPTIFFVLVSPPWRVSPSQLRVSRPTQPSIPQGSVNEYQLGLGRQRQVWFIPLADERGVCR